MTGPRIDAIRIGPRRVVFILSTVAVLLVAAHLVLLLITATTGRDYMLGLVPLFDLDQEQNVPSFFSGTLFFLNGLLLWLVGRITPQPKRATVWYVLAVVFLFLSYDELFGVHERLTRPLQAALQTTGFFYYAWVIAYSVPVLALIIWFMPTWRSLDAAARNWLTTAGVLFFSGAIVTEMIGGAYDEAFGHKRTLNWGLLVAVEESLEMAGLVTLLHALFLLLSPSAGGAPFVFDDGQVKERIANR